MIRSFEDFITVDVLIGDSDPVYFGVAGMAERDKVWATKFCVAMLAYYRMDVASKAADADDFWNHLLALYPTAPRGAARRHFRGEAGLLCLGSMQAWSPDPTKWFDRMGHTYGDVVNTCKTSLVGFGPYFQLKVCDFMDRCLGQEIVNYNGLDRNLPSEPAKALKIVGGTFKQLCDRVDLLDLPAPPGYDRRVGPAEVETSLCGYIHVRNGSTWMGEDILNKRNDLPEDSPMEQFMPTLVPRNAFKCELP